MAQSFGNVHFLGVARVAQGQGIVIASHAYNSETDLNGVKQALEQSTSSMSPGKHYSFTVGSSNAWHLIAGLCRCSDKYDIGKFCMTNYGWGIS